jgi:hypothetical protein
VCGQDDPLTFTEEVFLLQIVQIQLYSGEPIFHHIIDEETQDFIFDPYFFHFECWEDLLDDLKKEVEDQPPIQDAYSAFKCKTCGSGIREWEYAGMATYGEFHVSRRFPDGEMTARFQPCGKADIYCLYCLSVVNHAELEMWDDLSQHGECMDCVHLRCWRFNTCDCACHTEATE